MNTVFGVKTKSYTCSIAQTANIIANWIYTYFIYSHRSIQWHPNIAKIPNECIVIPYQCLQFINQFAIPGIWFVNFLIKQFEKKSSINKTCNRFCFVVMFLNSCKQCLLNTNNGLKKKKTRWLLTFAWYKEITLFTDWTSSSCSMSCARFSYSEYKL